VSHVPEVRPAEVSGCLASYRVIDVRERSEFEGALGRIPGSEHVALRDLEARCEALRGRPLLVVCRSGNRSARACALLAEHGNPDATNLGGGMIAWNLEGLPVDRSPFDSTASIVDALVTWLSQVRRLTPAAARSFVAERLPAGMQLEDPRQDVAAAALAAVAEALLSEDAPPADLELVCAALGRDLRALSDAVG
jgi:rhodanese-related sulfurtransferase